MGDGTVLGGASSAMVEHPPQWFEDSRRSSEQRIADLEQRVECLQAIVSSADAGNHRWVLEAFFARHNPEMISNVEKLLV